MSTPTLREAAQALSNAEIDEVVYACRQAGDDSTYAIVREAIRRAALTQAADAGAAEPFGYWHQGATEEESDFFKHGDMGNVACEKCITLYAAPPAQQAVAWPRDAAEVRQFMKGNCASLEWAVDEATPHQDDRYQLTAHDFLSAVNWWADFPHLQAAQQLQQAVARAARWDWIASRWTKATASYHRKGPKEGQLKTLVLTISTEEKGQGGSTHLLTLVDDAIRQQGTP